MNPLDVLAQFGWLALLIYFFITDLWPRLWEKLFPAYAQEREAKERARLRATEDEREHRQRMEERSVVAQEQTAAALVKLAELTSAVKADTQYTAQQITVVVERMPRHPEPTARRAARKKTDPYAE